MREAALLQSFPMNFKFEGTFDSIFKQIGEAVPPKFSSAIAVNVLIELLSPPPRELEQETKVVPVVKPVSSSYSSVIAGMKLARGQR